MSNQSDLSAWQKRITSQGTIVRSRKVKPPLAGRGGFSQSSSEHTATFTRRIPKSIGTSPEDVKEKIDRSLFSNPAGAVYKTKEPKNTTVNSKVQAYIDVWNTTPFPKLLEFKGKSPMQTKKYKATVTALRHLMSSKLYTGKVPNVQFPPGFEKQALRVPLERFKYLVHNFEKMAFDNNYLPTNKTFLAKTHLIVFLIGNGPYGSTPSLLLEKAIHPAVLNTATKPVDPKLTAAYIKSYLTQTGKLEAELTMFDRNNLVGASNKYLLFFDQYKGSFEFYGFTDPIHLLSEYYWKALGGGYSGSKIKRVPVAYLNSSAVIDRSLVPYFMKINMLKDHDLRGTTAEYWDT